VPVSTTSKVAAGPVASGFTELHGRVTRGVEPQLQSLIAHSSEAFRIFGTPDFAESSSRGCPSLSTIVISSVTKGGGADTGWRSFIWHLNSSSGEKLCDSASLMGQISRQRTAG